MSAPAPRESEKSTPRQSQQPGQNSGATVSSAGRTRLQEEVRRTVGFDEQSKLVEADRGPEPSPEVAAEIAAERQAKQQCGPNADIALLAEVIATEARVRPLIDEIQTTGKATIAACAAAMKSSAGEVVGWANRENKALIELFSEFAASLEGGQIDGDLLGVLSLLNMFNPAAAKVKAIFSLVITGAGFMARRYNDRLAEWRKSETGAALGRLGMRVGGVGGAQLATWQEMFSRLADGSLEVSELSFQAGQLDGLLIGMGRGTALIRRTCKDGGKPDLTVTEIVRGTMEDLRQLEAGARENLLFMRSLPRDMAAENKAGLERMKARYIVWLAQQGAIRVRGRLYADQQTGADVLHVALDKVTAIEGLESSGLSAETAQTICSKPGRVLEAGGTLELTLDSVIHGHRSETTRSEGDSKTPETFQAELNVRIGPKGTTGSFHGYGISGSRLENLIRTRQ